MRRVRGAIVALTAALLTLGLGAAPATAGSPQPLSDQKTVLQQLGVQSFGGVVVDSAMTYQQAIGDSVVPAAEVANHQAIRPYLRVVPVAYWGLGSNGQPDNKIHVGQIVIHKALVTDTAKVFAKMFQLKFPIYTVIPHSKFGYNDAVAMAANNTSGYRPDGESEHTRGAAFDVNPFKNPFDRSADLVNPKPIEPAGSEYNVQAPGTITKYGAVRLYWSSLGWEWGGNWGDPAADPRTDFFRVGFFDYQHFQLSERAPANRYSTFNAQLPQCLQDWTCQSEYELVG